MQDRCDHCHLYRSEEFVFVECPCKAPRLYSEAEEARIRAEFTEFETFACKFNSSCNLTLACLYIDFLHSLGQNTHRIIRNSRFYVDIHHRLNKFVRDVRAITLSTYYERGGKSKTQFDRFMYMTPTEARLIRFNRCIYVAHDDKPMCRGGLHDDVICPKHKSMFLEVRLCLAEYMPTDLVRICLDYDLQEWSTVPSLCE